MHTIIEISKQSFLKNISILKNFSKYSYIVVKANAYGHGLSEIVSILSSLKDDENVDGIALVYNEEAIDIKNWKKKILIMAPQIDEYFDYLICYFPKIEFFVYSIEFLKELNFWTKINKKKVNIHLKIETGLNRLGILNCEIEDCIDIITENIYIEIIGIATHYRDPYRYEDEIIYQQQDNLKKSIKIINEVIKKKSRKFSIIYINGASSGVVDCNEFNTNRCGSAAYGFWKSPEQKKRFSEKYPDKNFEEILTWKTKILQIKNVKEGEFIGYGIETVANENKKIGIVSVGYVDGYSIIFSHRKNASVLINDFEVNVIGKLGMNLFAIDLTNFNKINIKDDVFLINKKNKNFSIENLSLKIGLSALQVTTLISPSIKRNII